MADISVVGRGDELAALAAFVASVEKAPAGLLLQGEPGIGKTMLWEAAVSEARNRGVRVLACRPSSPEAGLSFAALGDLLDGVDLEALVELPPPQRHALGVALLLEEPAGPMPSQRATDVAFLGVLRLLGGAAPVLVAIDDAQWLDPPSAGVLEFAWRRLRTEPIGFLLARRDGASDRAIRLDSSAPATGVIHVDVGPLSAGAIQRLLRTRLGLTFSRPTLLRVHKASGGNPFYALELGRVLQSSGGTAAADEPLHFPDTLAALVRARLAALPKTAHDMLLAIAASGQPTVSLLEAYTGEPQRVRARLRRVVAADVVRLEGEQIRFTHPLLGASVYDDASPETRRLVHQRLASVVPNPEERARHLALSSLGPDAVTAAALDDAAGIVALRGASASAAELAELAARMTPVDRQRDLVRRSLIAAEHHVESGSFDRAAAILQPLLEELPPGGDRADVLTQLAAASVDLVAHVELCERALHEAAGDDRRLSRIHLLLALGWPIRGGSTHALRHGRLALEHAERCGDRGLVTVALSNLALLEIWAGQPTPGLLERAVGLRRPADAPAGMVSASPQFTLAVLRGFQGRFEEARELFEAELAEAGLRGDEPASVDLHGRLAVLECRSGNWVRAAEHTAAAFELGEQIGFLQGQSILFCQALLDAHYGRVPETRAAAEQGADLSAAVRWERALIFNSGAVGFLELSLGNAVEADRYLRPAVEWLTRMRMCFATSPAAPYAVEALIEVGELQAARPLVAQLEREGTAIESAWAVALAARLRGQLDAAAGNLSAAVEWLERALEQQEGMGWPFERARTLFALGEVHRRAKRKRAAREALTSALETFEELGAALWVARAQAGLSRISGRSPGTGELTPTEERVAVLVARGGTNREVAAALFVTPRTIEWNLSKIYAKLGVRSRSELARRLALDEDRPASP